MKYDPEKQYTWANDSVFQLSGKDLGLILNSLRAILNTEQAAQILLAAKANDAIENIIAEHIETGIVVEIPKNEKEGNE